MDEYTLNEPIYLSTVAAVAASITLLVEGPNQYTLAFATLLVALRIFAGHILKRRIITRADNESASQGETLTPDSQKHPPQLPLSVKLSFQQQAQICKDQLARLRQGGQRELDQLADQITRGINRLKASIRDKQRLVTRPKTIAIFGAMERTVLLGAKRYE